MRALKTATVLVAVCVPAGACSTSKTQTHAAGQPTKAQRTGHSDTPPATRAAVVSAAEPGSARAVAAVFAAAYARYLEGRLGADELPSCTPAARALLAQSGPLPARLRAMRWRLIGLWGGGSSWSARLEAIGAVGHGALSAQLTLTRTSSGWQVTAIDPPDPDDLLLAPRPAAAPSGPAAARAAALAFTVSWLAYSYGHATPAQLRDLTMSLRSALAANPPRVPPSIRGLYPRVASLALRAEGARWLASANVTDGQNTYQVIIIVGQVQGRWLVIALRSAG